jgi:hypothetical protein
VEVDEVGERSRKLVKCKRYKILNKNSEGKGT